MPEKEITLFEIYEMVHDIKTKVDVIDSKLSGEGGVFDRIKSLEVNDRLQDRFILKAIGAVSLLAILIPIAVKLILG